MRHQWLTWLKKTNQVLIANREQCCDHSALLPLEEYDYVVCDTELTGLNRRKDEIISIGAVRISSLEIELGNTFHALVRPCRLSPNQATFVHRITPEQLKQAPSIDEVLPAFITFCGGAVLVGHCIGLDLHFLNLAARKHLGGAMANPSVDTMNMARLYKATAARQGKRFVDSPGSLVLDDLTVEFNLPRFKPHDALEDALQTAYLFLYLVKKLQGLEVRTLQDVELLGRRKEEEKLF